MFEGKPIQKIFVISLITSIITAGVIGFLAGTLSSQFFAAQVNKEIAKFSLLKGISEKLGLTTPTILPLPSPYIPTTEVSQEEAVIAAVRQASPAVVSIIISKDLPVLEQCSTVNPFQGFGDQFFQQFFPELQIPQYCQKGTKKQEVGGGSGFIISSDGLILTNKHVVSDETAEYTVLTNDGKRYPATVLARDPGQDIAVLKINKIGLPTVKLGDSSRIEIGQSVIAIGNALGEFRNTVSVGVISGLARSVTASGTGGFSETIEGVIQTDAAINPGNSGGPLLNLKGEVIGINTAVVQGAQSIGFAIPINRAKRDIESVKTLGRIVTPWLGVRYTMINSAVAEKNQPSVDYGALIARGQNQGELAVIPGSPADKAGLQENDIILEVNAKKLGEDYTLAMALQSYNVGEAITLKVLRRGNEIFIKVTLEERK